MGQFGSKSRVSSPSEGLPTISTFTENLPKTRLGKLMRRLLRDVAEGRQLGDVTTLANAEIVEKIRETSAGGADEQRSSNSPYDLKLSPRVEYKSLPAPIRSPRGGGSMGRNSPHKSVRALWLRIVGAALPITVAGLVALTPAQSSAGPASSMHSGRMALSGGLLNAIAFHESGIAPRGSARAVPDVTVLPNVRVSNNGASPADETPIAANPLNSLQLESGANDYNCTSLQGFYNSDDGGNTWAHQHCMALLAGKSGAGDPNVAYGLDGTAYILGIDANASFTTGSIALEKSTNNGVTWSGAIQGPTAFYSNGLTDKEWTEIDQTSTSPHAGCIYTSITQFDPTFTKETITVDHSCDSGTTWSGPKAASTQALFPSVNQFSDLAIGDDGTVYVTWMNCSATGPAGDCGGTLATMNFAKSTDGGNTFTAPTTITTAMLTPDTCGAFYGCLPTTTDRVSNIPVIDVNSGNTLYVAYYHYTGAFMQLRVRKSIDGGVTWGAAVNVFGTSSADQFLHWLSVDDVSGKIGVTYLLRTGSTYKETIAVSLNGGTSYKANKPIATAPSTTANCKSGGGTPFLGDYTGNIWAGSTLHATWPDARTGTCEDEWGGVAF